MNKKIFSIISRNFKETSLHIEKENSLPLIGFIIYLRISFHSLEISKKFGNIDEVFSQMFEIIRAFSEHILNWFIYLSFSSNRKPNEEHQSFIYYWTSIKESFELTCSLSKILKIKEWVGVVVVWGDKDCIRQRKQAFY